MGKDRRLPLAAAAGALLALAACASIAGLEDPGTQAAPRRKPDGGGTGALGNGIVVQPDNVTITTSCTGAASETPAITIDNQSNDAATYELQVPEGSPFALSNDNDASSASLKGTVAARQSVSVRLQATVTKAGSFSGQLIVQVGERVLQVPVQVTVSGADLALVPTLVDFGEVRQQTTSPPQTIELENTGTEPVTVVGFHPTSSNDAGADFAITSPSANIAPGQKATATATFLAGNAGPPLTATFEPRTASPTCGQLPKLTLKGTRVNQDVTVNPASVNFGEVDCLAPGGATKTITVSNYANVPAAFDASTPAGSWFTIAPTNGTVPAASGSAPGTTDITVTLNAMGSTIGDHSDPIEVDVTSPQARTTTVTASVKSVGAILTIQPLLLDGFSNDQTKTFNVQNVGNKFVYVRHTSSSPSAFAVVNGTNDNALYPNSIFPANVDVKFAAQQEGKYTAQVTTTRANAPLLYPASGTICQTPAVVTVKGTMTPKQ